MQRQSSTLRVLYLFVVVSICLAYPGLSALAAAPALQDLPRVFSPWGTVTIDGSAAPDGVTVSAWIDNVNRGEGATVVGYYALSINGTSADLGKTVSFRVNGILAPQTGVYQDLNDPQINLTVRYADANGDQHVLPTATNTSTPTPTNTPADARRIRRRRQDEHAPADGDRYAHADSQRTRRVDAGDDAPSTLNSNERALSTATSTSTPTATNTLLPTATNTSTPTATNVLDGDELVHADSNKHAPAHRDQHVHGDADKDTRGHGYEYGYADGNAHRHSDLDQRRGAYRHRS